MNYYGIMSVIKVVIDVSLNVIISLEFEVSFYLYCILIVILSVSEL